MDFVNCPNCKAAICPVEEIISVHLSKPGMKAILTGDYFTLKCASCKIAFVARLEASCIIGDRRGNKPSMPP